MACKKNNLTYAYATIYYFKYCLSCNFMLNYGKFPSLNETEKDRTTTFYQCNGQFAWRLARNH